MKNVYLAQVNYRYGNNAFLPYSVARLWAYAALQDDIRSRYRLAGLLWERTDPVATAYDLVNPAVVGISHYVWNAEWNKAFAKAVRRLHPECLIVAGGPQVPDRQDKVTDEFEYFHQLVHGEGEHAFVDILRGELKEKHSVSSRVTGLDSLPSPYLSNLFDDLLSSYLNIQWQASQETNRGCPYQCTFCLTEDNELLTDSGIMTISKIVESDKDIKVWTEQGFYPVIHRFSRHYRGDIISIKTKGRPKIKCTIDHPWIVNNNVVKAGDLTSQHRLTISLPKTHNYRPDNIDLTIIIDGLIIKGDKVKFQSGRNSINRFIAIDDALLRLSGLFIAEGHVHKHKNRPNSFTTVWTYGKHEGDLIDETVSLIRHCFDLIPSVYATDTAIQVTIHSSIIGVLFTELFGTRSENIRIPFSWMVWLSNHDVLILLMAYFNGDGCYHINKKNPKGRTIASTTSKTLAFQVQLILYRLGIQCGISYREPKVIGNTIQGRIVNVRRQYRLEFQGGFHDLDESLYEVRIKSIEKSFFDGTVYNIEVEDKHTYSINGIESRNCDWGSATYSKVRKFDLDYIADEIDWMAQNKIGLVYNCDANFGMLEQDTAIVDALVESKQRWGYPQQFRAAYAKKTTPRVFAIGKTLSDAGMCKGVTLSMQSMSPVVQKAIKRPNIPTAQFGELMKQYKAAGVPTYSEIILGLPGETRESFMAGVCQLFELGQHDGLNIYPCMLLKNSEMAEDKEIRTVDVPMILNHASAEDKIGERYQLVIETPSMPYADWLDAFVFGWFVQVLHTLGAARIVAMETTRVFDLNYHEFYTRLYRDVRSSPIHWPVLHEEMFSVSCRIHDVVTGRRLNWGSEIDGISWPIEEASFLRIMDHYEDFIDELRDYITFQYRSVCFTKNVIRSQFKGIKKPSEFENYARDVVWYGRKGGSVLK